MTGSPDGRGEERLVRPEDLAQYDGSPSGDRQSGIGDRPSGIWPALTIVLATVTSAMAVVVRLATATVDPDPFAFTTTNVFWLIVTTGIPAVLTIAVGAAGMRPRRPGARGVRIAAAVLTGLYLVLLGVIAGVQFALGARPVVLLQTGAGAIAGLLAAGAVVLGFLAARRGTTRPGLIGLGLVLTAQVVLTLGKILAVGADPVIALGIVTSALTPAASLTALWLVGRDHPRTVWTGALILCGLAVVTIGSAINIVAIGLPGTSLPLQTVQIVLYLGAAVAAVLAARTATDRA